MIAGIADIARHRRDRKSKATILCQPAPINAQIRETHANLGWSGMRWDEPGGEGASMLPSVFAMRLNQEVLRSLLTQ
jgi:hypothetical protein